MNYFVADDNESIEYHSFCDEIEEEEEEVIECIKEEFSYELKGVTFKKSKKSMIWKRKRTFDPLISKFPQS